MLKLVTVNRRLKAEFGDGIELVKDYSFYGREKFKFVGDKVALSRSTVQSVKNLNENTIDVWIKEAESLIAETNKVQGNYTINVEMKENDIDVINRALLSHKKDILRSCRNQSSDERQERLAQCHAVEELRNRIMDACADIYPSEFDEYTRFGRNPLSR